MKTQSLIPRIFLLLILVFSLVTCSEKPESLIGLDLIGDNKPFLGFDTTLAVYAYSQTEDSVVSDELTINQIGSMYTPTFGLTNASLFMQLRLATLNPDFGDNPEADSVIFTLVYDNSYGNLNTQQQFNIFPVTEDFYRDSTYWSNTSFSYDDALLFANHAFLPDLSKQMVVDTSGPVNDTSYLEGTLRIPMNTLFVATIFGLDPEVFVSNDAFKEGFKGIYIRPENVSAPGDGAILSFNLLNTRSDITIYYKPNPDSAQRTFRFIINSNNARVARYEHDYSLSIDQNFLNQVVGSDSSLGSENFYLQGLGGVMSVIKIPGLKSLADSGNIIINEAKLIFKVVDFPDDFQPAEKMVLFKYDAEMKTLFLPDQLQGEGYFGGGYDKNSKSYWFRLSLHCQNILNGETDFGMALFPTGKSVLPNETVFLGTSPSIPGHLKLEVIYTRIR